MGNKVFGYTGKTLRINLSNGKISTEDNSHFFRDWLGGGGYAAKILFDELREWVTPFEPANKIIFSAGALLGTVAPSACKMTVSTIGPVTGGWATGSSDSFVGVELKHAGYDNIIIEGKSHMPCYLYVTDEIVEIRDATKMWGMTTVKTQVEIRKDLDDDSLHAAVIGPAGENLVRGACIIQDNRAFGRCGTGAVMGSKNLKALVCKGKKPVQVADKERFIASVKKCRKKILESPTTEKLRKYGTVTCLTAKQNMCQVPYKNFQDGKFPDDIAERIDPTKSIDKYGVGRTSFPGCVIGCGRTLEITDGPNKGLKTNSVQCETVTTLQGKLAVEEPTFMFAAHKLCNELGLDIDFTGGGIAWAMECYQRGILTEEDTGGIKLNWGDVSVILRLMEMISRREGFGNLLAEGCMRAATLLGRDSGYYAIHIKGQALYETLRGCIGWCLGAITSTRGGGHTTGTPVYDQYGPMSEEDAKKAYELLGVKNVEKGQGYEDKPELVYYFEVLQRVCNCVGICQHTTIWNNLKYIDIHDIAELISSATGIEFTADDLGEIAMRQLNVEKAINLRHTDFARKDDYPDEREFNEPIKSGNLAGWTFDKEKFEKMMDRYYEIHGWDIETSYPTRETLQKYGLNYIADELERIGKLGKG